MFLVQSDLSKKKKKIKNTNSKMTTNSQLPTTKPKKSKAKTKELSKQLEWEQIHRSGDLMEGYQQGRGAGRMGEKAQGIRNINGRCKIDRGRLRIV